MDGAIGVNSEPGHGSEFWVKIPVGEAPQEESAIRRPAPRSQARATGHALLVDDNTVNQQVGKKLLSKLGWTADIAGDGAEAVEMASRCEYRLILMDCQMPVMDDYASKPITAAVLTKVLECWAPTAESDEPS